jgi:co-chaperonin GroES (HSP10)
MKQWTSMIERMTPLHDRVLVRYLHKKPSSSDLILVRENPDMMDYIGQGDNGGHDDNRRVGIVSQVISVGDGVRDIAKGDVIMHTAWDDLPEWLDHKGYAAIRVADVFGHYFGEEYQC